MALKIIGKKPAAPTPAPATPAPTPAAVDAKAKGSPELETAMTTIANVPAPAKVITVEEQKALAASIGMETKVINGVSTMVKRRATDTPDGVQPIAEVAVSASPFEDTPAPAKPVPLPKGNPPDAIQLAEAHPYSIFHALDEHAAGKIGTLSLSHRESGLTYTVLGYNPKTKAAILKNSDGLKLNPVLTDREAMIYVALWR